MKLAHEFPKLLLTLALCSPLAIQANQANQATKPGHEHQQLTFERQVKLQGADNFRDLGGYLTKEGLQVKTGLIYRSDALDNLSEQDIETLNQLGLHTVVDFRSHIERRLEPDVLPDTVEKKLNLQIGIEAVDPVAFRKRFLSGKVNGEQFRQMIIDGNRQMAREGEKPFGTLLQTLVDDPQQPLVFHCAGGKDRTGLASAILLSLLGVPHKTIIEDYLLTNHYRHEHHQASAAKLNQLYPEIGPGLNQARMANAEYLQAGLDEIYSNYGSMENYAEQVLKISKEDIQTLRRLYLQKPQTQAAQQ